jgi:hypothetical protein
MVHLSVYLTIMSLRSLLHYNKRSVNEFSSMTWRSLVRNDLEIPSLQPGSPPCFGGELSLL